MPLNKLNVGSWNNILVKIVFLTTKSNKGRKTNKNEEKKGAKKEIGKGRNQNDKIENNEEVKTQE